MTEQIQKKKYVIKRVLSEEDVNKIRDAIVNVLKNEVEFYHNLLGILIKPINKFIESNKQEAERSLFINSDVYRYLKKYVTAHVLSYVIAHGYLPWFVDIVINYNTKNKVIVKIVVDAEALRYIYGFARDWKIEILSFDENDNITPKKIVNRLKSDIEGLIDIYRREFSGMYIYELDLEDTLNWLRRHGEQVDEEKVKEIREIKARLQSSKHDLEDLLREYRL
jgi:hypothetical protein